MFYNTLSASDYLVFLERVTRLLLFFREISGEV
jgi:hypothetical protein